MKEAGGIVAEIQAAVRGGERVLPAGGHTKPGLSTPEVGAASLDTARLRGITSYDPGELTFTALAGTPVVEIEAALAEHGQHLPFDPPLSEAGATLGGAVAAGIAGPGAFGAGIVRDFVIGVTLVDGRGRLVSGGGRVVKNAAGFDLPKLVVGSAGRLGVIVELSCKVFPRPASYATVAVDADTFAEALGLVGSLARAAVGLVALELEPPGRVLARLGGDPDLLGRRVERLQELVRCPSRLLAPDEERALWRGVRELSWAPEAATVAVVPVTLAEVASLEPPLAAVGASRRYGVGASFAWIAWPGERSVEELSELLESRGLDGMLLFGRPAGRPLLGASHSSAFGERVRAALDPDRRFLELWP